MDKKKIIVGLLLVITISAGLLLLSTLSRKGPDASVAVDQGHGHDEGDQEENVVTLTAEQIKKYDIATITLNKSHFQQRLTFPGQISLDENAITHIVSAVPGTVKEIYKGLGEETKPGEVLATIQSREMAEAKSGYLSAFKNVELLAELLKREEELLKQKIKAEIKVIQTRNQYATAKIALDQAKQKLLALGVPEAQILKLPEQQTPLNLYNIDSPIRGRVIERHVTLGEVINSDKQLFVIANLDTIWVNLAIPAEDLPFIKKDQKAEIFAHQGSLISNGTIMYVSPVINEDSRTGRAIIQLENTRHEFHPGDFVKAQVITMDKSSLLSLPSSAIQRTGEEKVVFKEIDKNKFQAQPVSLKGSNTGDFAEIISGLKEGDKIVVKNSFLLKAELGKSEAEHTH